MELYGAHYAVIRAQTVAPFDKMLPNVHPTSRSATSRLSIDER